VNVAIDATDIAQLVVAGPDGNSVTIQVGPRPSGEPGVCVVDAFGPLPSGSVTCVQPDSRGRLLLSVRVEPVPTIFIDERVNCVVYEPDVPPGSPPPRPTPLTLIEVPGVPGARVAPGVGNGDGVISFLDRAGSQVLSANLFPPDR
jgi:hypothetical protein